MINSKDDCNSQRVCCTLYDNDICSGNETKLNLTYNLNQAPTFKLKPSYKRDVRVFRIRYRCEKHSKTLPRSERTLGTRIQIKSMD